MAETKTSRGFWIVCGFVALFVIYALSVGPVLLWAKNANNSSGTGEFILGFYAPLQYAYENSEIVKAFYDWYLGDLWNAV